MTEGGRSKSPGFPAVRGANGWTMTSTQKKSLYPANLEHRGHSDLQWPPNRSRNVTHPIPGVSSTQVASALVSSSEVRPAFPNILATSKTGAFALLRTGGLYGSEVDLQKKKKRKKKKKKKLHKSSSEGACRCWESKECYIRVCCWNVTIQARPFRDLCRVRRVSTGYRRIALSAHHRRIR